MASERETYPLHVVVVGLLGLNSLQNCLVLVSHSQQIPLPSRLVQTAKYQLVSIIAGYKVCYTTLKPSLFVVVDVVDAAFGPHDARHLVQEDSVVSLHDAASLLFHLQFLQVEVEVHVRLRRLVVDHRPGVTDLI